MPASLEASRYGPRLAPPRAAERHKGEAPEKAEICRHACGISLVNQGLPELEGIRDGAEGSVVARSCPRPRNR